MNEKGVKNMSKKRYLMVMLCCAITLVLVACGGSGSSTAPSKAPANTVHMNSEHFVQINGTSSGTISPFPTADTFKLYCTIHTGINPTVVVQ
jgi:ABC-type oligopeptide transport system substrate-binding subunit